MGSGQTARRLLGAGAIASAVLLAACGGSSSSGGGKEGNNSGLLPGSEQMEVLHQPLSHQSPAYGFTQVSQGANQLFVRGFTSAAEDLHLMALNAAGDIRPVPFYADDNQLIAMNAAATEFIAVDTKTDQLVIERASGRTVLSGEFEVKNAWSVANDQKLLFTVVRRVEGKQTYLNDLYIYDRNSKQTTRLSQANDIHSVESPSSYDDARARWNRKPVLTADGQRVVYMVRERQVVDGRYRSVYSLMSVAVDGSDSQQIATDITSGSSFGYNESFAFAATPDGQKLLYLHYGEDDKDNNARLFISDIRGGNKKQVGGYHRDYSSLTDPLLAIDNNQAWIRWYADTDTASRIYRVPLDSATITAASGDAAVSRLRTPEHDDDNFFFTSTDKNIYRLDKQTSVLSKLGSVESTGGLEVQYSKAAGRLLLIEDYQLYAITDDGSKVHLSSGLPESVRVDQLRRTRVSPDGRFISYRTREVYGDQPVPEAIYLAAMDGSLNKKISPEVKEGGGDNNAVGWLGNHYYFSFEADLNFRELLYRYDVTSSQLVNVSDSMVKLIDDDIELMIESAKGESVALISRSSTYRPVSLHINHKGNQCSVSLASDEHINTSSGTLIFSATGDQLVLNTMRGDQSALYLVNADNCQRQPITFAANGEHQARFFRAKPVAGGFILSSDNGLLYLLKAGQTQVLNAKQQGGVAVDTINQGAFQLTPDGRKVLYHSGRGPARDGIEDRLYVADIDGSNNKKLSPDNLRMFDFSSSNFFWPLIAKDSTWVYYTLMDPAKRNRSILYKSRIDGSETIRLVDNVYHNTSYRSFWLSEDQQTLVYRFEVKENNRSNAVLKAISVNGGAARQISGQGDDKSVLLYGAANDSGAMNIAQIPATQTIVYRSRNADAVSSIYRVNLDGSQAQKITQAADEALLLTGMTLSQDGSYVLAEMGKGNLPGRELYKVSLTDSRWQKQVAAEDNGRFIFIPSSDRIAVISPANDAGLNRLILRDVKGGTQLSAEARVGDRLGLLRLSNDGKSLLLTGEVRTSGIIEGARLPLSVFK